MALKRKRAKQLPPSEFFKLLRFGPPTYDDEEDSSKYTLVSDSKLEDSFELYEKRESEVPQSSECLTTAETIKNSETGKYEETETEKEEENESTTEEDSEAGGEYFEDIPSNSESEDFLDTTTNLIYECRCRTDTGFRVRMFGCLTEAPGGAYEMRVLEGGDGAVLTDVEALIQGSMPDMGDEIPACAKFKCQQHIQNRANNATRSGV